MFEKFTDKAIKAMMLAQEEARRLGHNFVGTEQILLGMIGEGTGIAAKALKSKGVNLKDARLKVEKIIGRGAGFVAKEIPFTPRAKRLLEYSCYEAQRLRHDYVGTEHLLLGLIQEATASLEDNSQGVATRVLQVLNIDLNKLEDKVFELIGIVNPPRVSGEKFEPKSEPVEDKHRHTRPIGDGIVSGISSDVFGRLTDEAVNCISLSREEAIRCGHNFIGTEQLLLGLIRCETGIAARALKSMGVDLSATRIETEKIIGRGSGFFAAENPLTPRTRRVFDLSIDEARQLKHDHIGTEHLLLGLIREKEGVAIRVLLALGIDLNKLRSAVLKALNEQ